MDDEIKLHWYCFTFYYGSGMGSTYTGYSNRDLITIGEINCQKRNAEVPQNSVLSAVIYLGHMSKNEFTESGK